MPIGPWFPSQLRGPVIGLARDTFAPVNTVAPVASGTVTIGGTLSVTTGTWVARPSPTFTYQWKRDGVSIAAATASSYTPIAADIGAAITCVVTATNATGTANATSNTLQYTTTSLTTAFGSSLKLLSDERNQTVSQWDDQSGNAFHWTQATANRQPQTGGTIGGVAALTFSAGDAQQDNVQSTTVANVMNTTGGANAFYSLFVINLTSHLVADTGGFAEGCICADTGGFFYPCVVSVSGIHGGVFTTVDKVCSRVAISNATDVLWECKLTGGTLSGRLGSTSATDATSVGNIGGSSGNLRIGDRGAGPFLGKIAFVLIANAVPSASVIADARAFLTYKYGVAS